MLASRHEKRLPFDVKETYASLFSLKRLRLLSTF